jgi:hypothetical protein
VNAQKITKILLLLFVAASLFALIFVPDEKEIISEKAIETAAQTNAVDTSPVTTKIQTTETGAATESTSQKAPGTTLVVSYYHGSARCVSCRTIEAFAAEAVKKYFSSQLENGEIKWQEVNIQTPENAHYVKRYQLFTQSVILSLQKNGDEVKWKNLDQVWQLIRNQEQFHAYIKKEVEAMLAENKS